MYQKIVVIMLLLFLPSLVFSFECSMPSLKVPSNIEKGESIFVIQHRFYGPIDEEPLDSFLGMDVGANIGFTLRRKILPQIELKVSRIRHQKEYILGGSYAYFFSFIRTQADVEYFSYEKIGIKKRRQNIFYNLSLQSEPIFHKISLFSNIAYDGYTKKAGMGLGINIDFEFEVGALQKVGFIGEYYPSLDEEVGITGKEDSFGFGVNFQTYGHHFLLLLGNNFGISSRRCMLGTDTTNLYFGFNIDRIFQ